MIHTPVCGGMRGAYQSVYGRPVSLRWCGEYSGLHVVYTRQQVHKWAGLVTYAINQVKFNQVHRITPIRGTLHIHTHAIQVHNVPNDNTTQREEFDSR